MALQNIAVLLLLVSVAARDCEYFNKPKTLGGTEKQCGVTKGAEEWCYSCCPINPEPWMCCDDGSCMPYDKFCRYNTSCCATKYCGDRCCSAAQGQPCGPICAPNGYTCCNDTSGMLCKAPDKCCGNFCCDSLSQRCCGDHCCEKDSTCCGELCCPKGNKCCMDPTPHCCLEGNECTDVGDDCCPIQSDCSTSLCCPDKESCVDKHTDACCDKNWCEATQTCCHSCEVNADGGCCEVGQTFCTGGSRSACFNMDLSGAPIVCCDDGTACPPDHVCSGTHCCPKSHQKLCGQGGSYLCHAENGGDCGCCGAADCCYGGYSCDGCSDGRCGNEEEHGNWFEGYWYTCNHQPASADYVNAVSKLDRQAPNCKAPTLANTSSVMQRYIDHSQGKTINKDSSNINQVSPSFFAHGVVLPPAPSKILTPNSEPCYADPSKLTDVCATLSCLQKVMPCGEESFIFNVSSLYCNSINKDFNSFNPTGKNVLRCAQNCIMDLFKSIFSHSMKPCCHALSKWNLGYNTPQDEEISCWRKCKFCDHETFLQNERAFKRVFDASKNGNFLAQYYKACPDRVPKLVL